MKLPMSMLRDYVEIPIAAEAYAQRMIMTGTAVESVERPGEEIQNVVVGRVLTCERVEGTHLSQCTVDAGQEEPLHIVCGAPNVAVGILAPVALDGATLPGGHTIKKGKLRGMVSEGMLCSSTELNITQEMYPSVGEEGLLIFHEDYPVGMDIKPIVGLDDAIIDFEILANRPDCMCALGIARESAAALNTDFLAPSTTVKESGGDIRNEVKVSVLDPDLCPRYTTRVVKNVRIAPSPKWLRKYLNGAGLRSINNIVDITNFVMIEYGHPMHAFDLSKVRGREIIVRRARDGERLTTLDDVERSFTTDDLLICDAERATGIGGVMGGEESEITEATQEVMFECASFNRTSIRLTSRAQGMRTDASARFERGVSPHTTLDAINRACMLVDMLDAGDVVTGVIDIYPDPQEIKPVTASVSRICERSGVDIPAATMVEILEKLQFAVKLEGDTLTVTAPPHRSDIETEADVCEEVLRIYGFEEIGCTPLHGEQTPGGISPRMKMTRKVAGILHGMGYMEIMNFSFLSIGQIEKLNLSADDPRMDPLKVRNPLGEDSSVMRPTLSPDMLKTLSYNMNHSTPSVRLYEIAAVYDKHNVTSEGLPTETPTLCMGAYGDEMDFYAMRGAAEAVLLSRGVAYTVEPAAEPYLHPGRSAVLKDGDTVYATLGEVHPAVRDAFDMPSRAVIAEIDLALLQKASVPLGQLTPLPRFPSVTRDLALVMEESVAVGPLMAAIRKAGGNLLEDARMFDVYRSEQLGKSKKSVAFSLIFRAPDRTLTEPDIVKAMEKIQRSCAYQFGAVLR